MHRENIMLPDIETIKKFVTFANRFEFPVTLFSDKYRINGKSIMGIFGLDLTKPLEVEVDENYPSEFKEQLKAFQIESEFLENEVNKMPFKTCTFEVSAD